MPTLHKIKPRKLLLIDGLGALLSAFILGVVLIRFQSNIGMPPKVLNFCSILAGVFAVYSLTSYAMRTANHALLLKLIAVANILYCMLTLGFIVLLNHRLTTLGTCYFIAEIVVVLALATIELITAFKN